MNIEIFTPQLIKVLLWLAFGKFLTIGILTIIEKGFSSSKLRIYNNLHVCRQQTIQEIKSIWIVFTDAVFFALLVYFGWLKLSQDTPVNILLTFTVFFVWVEFWFYWSHRWLHQSKFLWQFHESHHQSILTQPLTAVSFSFIEKLVFYTCGWFLLPTLLSWYIPISAYGIAAYFACYYIFSPLGHMNLEAVYSLFESLPFEMNHFSSVAMSHPIHHIRYNANFGLITPVFDHIFGTHDSNKEENLGNLQEALK